jgi:hypothetical protein
MQPLFIFASLFPATGLSVVAFLVLFAADRSAGRLRRIGTVLGCWLFVLAALVIVAGVTASIVMPRHMDRMGHRGMMGYPAMMGDRHMGPYHHRMMREWREEATDNAAAAAPPASPPPEKK